MKITFGHFQRPCCLLVRLPSISDSYVAKMAVRVTRDNAQQCYIPGSSGTTMERGKSFKMGSMVQKYHRHVLTEHTQGSTQLAAF